MPRAVLLAALCALAVLVHAPASWAQLPLPVPPTTGQPPDEEEEPPPPERPPPPPPSSEPPSDSGSAQQPRRRLEIGVSRTDVVWPQKVIVTGTGADPDEHVHLRADPAHERDSMGDEGINYGIVDPAPDGSFRFPALALGSNTRLWVKQPHSRLTTQSVDAVVYHVPAIDVFWRPLRGGRIEAALRVRNPYAPTYAHRRPAFFYGFRARRGRGYRLYRTRAVESDDAGPVLVGAYAKFRTRRRVKYLSGCVRLGAPRGWYGRPGAGAWCGRAMLPPG